jgi:hypothetical protein
MNPIFDVTGKLPTRVNPPAGNHSQKQETCKYSKKEHHLPYP